MGVNVAPVGPWEAWPSQNQRRTGESGTMKAEGVGLHRLSL